MAQHRMLIRNWGSGFIAYVVACELQKHFGLNKEYVNPGVGVRQVDELFFSRSLWASARLLTSVAGG